MSASVWSSEFRVYGARRVQSFGFGLYSVGFRI